MCGIFGSIGKNYNNLEDTFLKELHHRGPDNRGVFKDHELELLLGQTRLSIIDLTENGHQPMIDETGNFIITLNGEIYNYKDIKRQLVNKGYLFSSSSDTEVVLKSYIEWGEECVKMFRGMFAFCIFNKKTEELFLARDRFGIKPLIYSFVDSQFVFTSELKPILKSTFFPKKISYSALGEYYKYGSVVQPNTILDKFYQLMPGHYMKVKFDLSYTIKKYYDLIDQSKKSPTIYNYNDALVLMRKELEDAVKFHLVADVDVGVFLSGGVDSTTIAAMMCQQKKSKLNTFTVGFIDQKEVTDETFIGSRTAQYLGTNHQNIFVNDDYVKQIFDDYIESMDQPSLDGLNSYIVSRETSKSMKVAISGLGGDEIFAGYSHFKKIQESHNKKSNGLVKIGDRIDKMYPNRFTKTFKYYGLSPEQAIDKKRAFNYSIKSILKRASTINNNLQINEGLTPIQKISKAESEGYLLNTLLRDVDIMSMANSLEVRPILLDHRLFETAFALNDEYKIRNGLLKSVFIESVKDLIPHEVWNRKKTGFSMPLSKWMNTTFNERFAEVSNLESAENIFTKTYLISLKENVRKSNLDIKNWIDFVLLNWLSKYDLSL